VYQDKGSIRKTINQIRVENGLPPIKNGSIIITPVFVDNVCQDKGSTPENDVSLAEKEGLEIAERFKKDIEAYIEKHGSCHIYIAHNDNDWANRVTEHYNLREPNLDFNGSIRLKITSIQLAQKHNGTLEHPLIEGFSSYIPIGEIS